MRKCIRCRNFKVPLFFIVYLYCLLSNEMYSSLANARVASQDSSLRNSNNDLQLTLNSRKLTDCSCDNGFISCNSSSHCTCIPHDEICDLSMNCPNGEDELMCENIYHCNEQEYECYSSKECIPLTQLCDQIVHCKDGSDEAICQAFHFGSDHNCSESDFICHNGQCIKEELKCDGDEDCADGSDELCPRQCNSNEFQCDNGICISSEWYCDSEKDCIDNSDEKDCKYTYRNCSEEEFRCDDKYCVPIHLKCDGKPDCRDSSDELSCPFDLLSCETGEFQCDNSSCIKLEWVCDKTDDCSGGEDELHCDIDLCPVNVKKDEVFHCSNGKCISKHRVCDGIADCGEGEDEMNCRDACNLGFFTCLNNSCINLKLVCNGHLDCEFGEDEENCTLHNPCPVPNRCEQLCFMNKEGGHSCGCHQGYIIMDDLTSCQDVDECQMGNPCSQICHNTKGDFKCDCVDGYTLRSDNITCKALGPPFGLILTNSISIRKIIPTYGLYVKVIDNLQNAVSLDYLYEKQLLFWSDTSAKAIRTAHLNGSVIKDIVWWGLERPEGIAIDWIHELLFWTDTSRKRIEVIQMDGNFRKTLIWTNIDKPRAIVVHPGKGLLLWTDWGSKPGIEKCFMDGSQRVKIITTGITWPNGLALDYSTSLIYWADAKEKLIECADLNGKRRKTIISKSIFHPLGLTIFEDYVFWTDYSTKNVYSANRLTGRDVSVLNPVLPAPRDIHSFHQQRQPIFANVCGNHNGGCSHLCLPNGETYSCSCSDGYKIKNDRISCELLEDDFLVFAHKSSIHTLFMKEDSFPDVIIPLKEINSVVGLDWNGRTKQIFWSDIESKTIHSANWNGDDHFIVVYDDLGSPTGIAVDWVTEKIYWTDDGNSHIEVANFNGSMRSLLVWTNLDHPRDIVVDPIGGYMYWSDWGLSPKIEKASMDGSDRVVIISHNITWPNGLAIDFVQELIYWCDAGTKTIEYASLDGKNRNILIGTGLSHPFGLTLYNDLAIWSDWVENAILSIRISNPKDRNKILSNVKNVTDVRVIHKDRQLIPSVCLLDNGGCSHLCLLAPPEKGGYSCGCPTGFPLLDDKHTCADFPDKALFFSDTDHVRMLSLNVPYDVSVVLSQPPILSVGSRNIVPLDIDPSNGKVYFSDTSHHTIETISPSSLSLGKQKLNGLLISRDLDTVEGLAVDEVGQKLYWTDAVRKSIEVADLTGNNRKVLFHSGLKKPRSIALTYEHGVMLWTDWGNKPKIEISSMDGTNRKVFVNKRLGWPNALAIDGEDNVFWTDAKLDVIEMCTIDGKNRKIVLGSKNDVEFHPYGVTVMNDILYWTDWTGKSLSQINWKTKDEYKILYTSNSKLMEVHALTKKKNEVKNVCGENNGGCSHLCLRSEKGHSCACPTGVVLNDGAVCSAHPETYLLFAAGSSIRQISFDTDDRWVVTLNIPDIRNAVSLDFHWKKQLLFYTDVYLDHIRMVHLSGNDSSIPIIKENLTTPEGVVVDWLSDNLYWADAARKVIEVARLDGSCRKIVIGENLGEPRAVAVYPRKGLLFWTDWGQQAKIERSYLDGSGRKAIVSNDLAWPNGLTIDYDSNRLFWADAKSHKIETSNLIGKNRSVLVQDLPHPFGLALLDSYIYWTDWKKKSIEQAHKELGNEKLILANGIDSIMEIRAVSSNKQAGWNPCVVQNGGCSHLCLYRPQGFICACPEKYDGRECSTEPSIIVPYKRPHDTSSSDYDDFDDSDDSYKVFNSDSKSPLLQNTSLYGILSASVALLLLLIIMVLVIWKKFIQKNNVEELEAEESTLTFSNPTYSSSSSDVALEVKGFGFKKMKYDRAQERVYEVNRNPVRGLEAASLINPNGHPIEHDTPPASPQSKSSMFAKV